ncbi:hypothetical protein AX16_000445 [Volvariella volvacea WC 439]|nr:hypothetical protein AX16_000445 [Volvariella volvacea WC 439]
MSQHPFIEFPVGERPGWEIEHGKGEDLKSIADSLTLYQSLRQSRNRWIYSTFPKFWSKGRGKLTSETAPSNSHCFRAKFELEIGPHIFPDTILYEVQYTPPQSSSSSANQAHTSNTWRSTPYVHYLPQNQLAAGTTPPIIASTPTSQARSNNPAPSSYSVKPNSSPVVSSLTTVTPITPALISKVNTAAATNPILANLLHLAAAGRASPDQLKTLGLLIQSLSDTPPEPNLVERSLPVPSHSHPLAPYNAAHSPSIAAQQPQTPVPPVKDFDLILEFQNLPTERWLLPRGPVVCHKLPGEFPTDIFLTVRVPLGTDETLAEKPDCPMPQAVVFCLKTVPLLVWDTLVRWIGGEEKMVANQKILDRLPRHDDTFLAHQIAEGTLLTQLQAATL